MFKENLTQNVVIYSEILVKILHKRAVCTAFRWVNLVKIDQIWPNLAMSKTKNFEILQNRSKTDRSDPKWSEMCFETHFRPFRVTQIGFRSILKDFKIFGFGYGQIWPILTKFTHLKALQRALLWRVFDKNLTIYGHVMGQIACKHRKTITKTHIRQYNVD